MPDPRLERLRALRQQQSPAGAAGGPDPRLARLRALRVQADTVTPGERSTAAAVFGTGEGEIPTARMPQDTSTIPSMADRFGLTDPTIPRQLVGNLGDLAVMGARDVAGTVPLLASMVKNPLNPLVGGLEGVEAGQRVRDRFTPALEVVNEVAGGHPQSLLGGAARLVGPLPAIGAARGALARAAASRSLLGDLGRIGLEPGAAGAARTADEMAAEAALRSAEGRAAEADAIHRTLTERSPMGDLLSGFDQSTLDAQSAARGRQAESEARVAGVVNAPRSPMGELLHQFDQATLPKVRGPVNTEIRNPVIPEMPTPELVEPSIALPTAAEASARRAAERPVASIDAGPPSHLPVPEDRPAAPPRERTVRQMGAPKFAKMTDEELFQRRHEVMDRMNRANIEAGKHIQQWSRYDDDVAAQRSGTVISAAGGRAIGRVKDDGRIIDEIDAELDIRGHRGQTLHDRYDDHLANLDERIGMEREDVGQRGDQTKRTSFLDDFMQDEAGSVPLGAVAPLTGALGGGAYGALSADDNESKVSRAVTYGALGFGAGVGLTKGAAALGRGNLNVPAGLQSAYERARGRIDFGGAQQAAADAAAAGGPLARIQRIAENVGNGLAPLERLGTQAERAGLRPTENPKYLLSYVKGADQTIRSAMLEGVLDPQTRQVVAPSYREVFEPLAHDPAKIEEALTYAVQKRAVGRGPQAFAGDAQAFADAQSLVNHWDTVPEMQGFAQRLEGFVDGLGNYAVKSGLWTPEQWAAIKASDALYVPFKRVMPEHLRTGARPAGLGAGTGLTNVTPGVQTFHGSRLAIADPALSLAEYAQAIIRRADRYRVGASIFDAADRLGAAGDLIISRLGGSGVPNTRTLRMGATQRALANAQAQGVHVNQQTIESLDDLFTPAFDHKNPVIWRNGPKGREYATVNAPDLVNAVSSLHQLNDEAVRKFLDVTLRPLRRIFVATTTGLTPRFAGGTNPARDVVDAFAKTQANITPADIARGYAEAIGGRAGRSRLVAEAERSGMGSVSNFSQPTRPDVYQRMLAPTTRLQKLRDAVRQTATAPLRPFEALGEVSDMGPRLGEYQAAQRQTRGQVASGAMTQEDANLRAATLGRQVTIDFSNKPGNPVLRLLADYVPFFGPSLNAPTSMAAAIRRNPARVAAVASGVATSSVIAWAMKHRSPEALTSVNDRTPGERGAFLFFPMDDKGDFTVRLPLGQEMGLIATGVTAGLDAFADQDPHAAEMFRESILRALPPNPVTESPVVGALIENARNRRSFGGAPVEPKRMEGLPAAERRLPTTSPMFDVLASAARAAGGAVGSESLADTSPLEAENVFRSVFSAATPLITEAVDPLAARLAGREAERKLPTPFRSSPFNPLGALVANPTPRTTASEMDFYRSKKEIGEANALAKAKAPTATDVEFNALLAQYAGALDPGAEKVVGTTDEFLKQMRSREQDVQARYRSGQLDGAAARTELDAIQRERSELYREAVGILRTIQPAGGGR